jgi:hypothetical protein
MRGLAQAGAATIETNLTLAADHIGFLIDPKPLSFSDKHIHLSCHAPMAACR